MKTSPLSLLRIPIAIASLLALPLASNAKDHDYHGRDSKHGKSSHDDHNRGSYNSHPSSGFTLSLGTGYAGRGYYYGPPNSSYYYQRPEVRYYATRESAPREYYSQGSYSSSSSGAAIQRALARRGYYQGYVDGDIGPQSRRAIARYQQDHGMSPTGAITQSLLRSLGLQ